MWLCPCSSQNEEDSLVCTSCGRERDLQESAEEEYPSALEDIEKAQRELEEPVHYATKEIEPVPTPAPTPTPAPAAAHRKTEEEEGLHLDIEEPGQSVYEDFEDLGKELGEVSPTPPQETEAPAYEDSYYEEEEGGSTGKRVLRIIDITLMCIVIISVAIYSIVQIGGVDEARFSTYLSRCLSIWIRSIIVTQAVVIIGGIIYFLLWEPKRTKAR